MFLLHSRFGTSYTTSCVWMCLCVRDRWRGIHCNTFAISAACDMFATIMQALNTYTLWHTHSHLHTQVYMELWEPFVEWRAVWSRGGLRGRCREVEVERRGRGAEVKTSWTYGNRLSLCLRLGEWTHVELGRNTLQRCVCVCVEGGWGGELFSVSPSFRSQLWCNWLNELVWNIELNSMNRVTCYSDVCACLRVWMCD